MVCARLLAILSEIEGISILGFAHSVAEAEPMIRVGRPDVVLIGSDEPRWNAIRLLQFIRREHPDTIAVMLMDMPGDMLQHYMDAGANFGFDKATGLDAMVDMLRHILKLTRGRRSAPNAGDDVPRATVHS